MSDKLRAGLPAGGGRAYSVLGDSITCKASGAETSGDWSLFEFATARGSAVPLHRHAWDEAYFVLDGELAFVVDGEPVTLGPGSFLNVPGGTPHALSNASAGETRYLMWAEPAGAERFFAELHEAASGGSLDIPAILGIAARNGIEALSG